MDCPTALSCSQSDKECFEIRTGGLEEQHVDDDLGELGEIVDSFEYSLNVFTDFIYKQGIESLQLYSTRGNQKEASGNRADGTTNLSQNVVNISMLLSKSFSELIVLFSERSNVDTA